MFARKLKVLTCCLVLSQAVSSVSLAAPATMSMGQTIDIAGSVRFTQSGNCLLFPDGSSQCTALVFDGSAIWGMISGQIENQLDLTNRLNLKEDKSMKGVSNGYAPLDANGKIPSSYLSAGSGASSYPVFQKSASLSGYTPTWQTQGNLWVEFTEFLFNFDKSQNQTKLAVHYSDNVGVSGAVWCNVGIFIDSDTKPRCSAAWSGVSYGTTFRNEHLFCNVSSVSSGSHSLHVKHRSTNCVYGNYAFDEQGGQRFLTVQEVN